MMAVGVCSFQHVSFCEATLPSVYGWWGLIPRHLIVYASRSFVHGLLRRSFLFERMSFCILSAPTSPSAFGCRWSCLGAVVVAQPPMQNDDVYAPVPLPILEDCPQDDLAIFGDVASSDLSVDYCAAGKSKLRAPAPRRISGPEEPPSADNIIPAALLEWMLDKLYLWLVSNNVKRRKVSNKSMATELDMIILALNMPISEFAMDWIEKRWLHSRLRTMWGRLYGMSVRQTNDNGSFSVLWKKMSLKDMTVFRLLVRALDAAPHDPLQSLRAKPRSDESEEQSLTWRPASACLVTWHTDFMEELAASDPPVEVPEDLTDIAAAVVLQKSEAFVIMFRAFTERVATWASDVDASVWGACAEFCGKDLQQRRVHLHAYVSIHPDSVRGGSHVPTLRRCTPESMMFRERRPHMSPVHFGRSQRRAPSLLAAGLYYVTADKVGGIARTANTWPLQDQSYYLSECRRFGSPTPLSKFSPTDFHFVLFILIVGGLLLHPFLYSHRLPRACGCRGFLMSSGFGPSPSGHAICIIFGLVSRTSVSKTFIVSPLSLAIPSARILDRHSV